MTPVEAAKLLRRKAYDLLDLASKVTSSSALRHCCRTRIPKRGRSIQRVDGGRPWQVPGEISSIEIRRRQGVAYLGGVQKCGSVWLCPVCATRIAGERRAEIDRVGRLHIGGGGAIAFTTLTTSHTAEMDDEELRRQLSHAWQTVQRSWGYRSHFKRLKGAGFLKKLEVTFGRNGFHPHIHLALFFDREFTRPEGLDAEGQPRQPSELVVLERVIFAEWRKAFVDAGFPAPSRRRGVKIEYVTPGSSKWMAYLAKMGFELSGTKNGRNGNRSMWEVLQDAGLAWSRCIKDKLSPARVVPRTDYDTGEVINEVVQVIPDVKIWRRFEKMIKGARQLEWSRALKRRYAIQDDTDEQLVLGELNEADELVLEIPYGSRLWEVVQRQPCGIALVIEAASDGMDALWDLLLDWGLDRRALMWCRWGDEQPPGPAQDHLPHRGEEAA